MNFYYKCIWSELIYNVFIKQQFANNLLKKKKEEKSGLSACVCMCLGEYDMWWWVM